MADFIKVFPEDYEHDDVVYTICETAEVHEKLKSDSKFAENYFKMNKTDNVGVDEDNDTAADHESYCKVEENPVELIVLSGTPASEGREFYWSRKSTQLLVKAYKQRVHQFKNPSTKKKMLWRQILNEFEKNGYKGLSIDALDRKFRNMKKTFRTILQSKRVKDGKRVAWEYYDSFVDIYGGDPEFKICSKKLGTNEGVGLKDELLRLCDETEKNESETDEEKGVMPGKVLCELRKLRECVERNNSIKEESNKIQQERNFILNKILNKM